MSDDANGTAPPATDTSTAPPIGTAPWRVPETDPRPWARGKTAEELLAVSDQMFNGLVQVANQQQAQPQYQAPVTQQQPIGDDDIVDGRTLKALLGQMANVVSQPDPSLTHSIGQLAYSQVKSADPSAFKKWEPEILANLNQLDKRMWTVDTIQRVVRMVKADHVEELAAERADHLIAQKGFSVRTSSAGVAGSGAQQGISLESDELPADYRERLQKAGISMDTVRSYCAANNMPVKEWFDLAKKNTGVMGGAK